MPKPKVRKENPIKQVSTTRAPEVEALGAELIERDHRCLKDAGVKYGFAGADRKMKTFGKVVLVREEANVLLERPGVQFLVVVSPAHWRRYSEQKRAQALDELLCSMSYDGKKPRIEKPDFRGFRANLLRYWPLVSDENEEAFRGAQMSFAGMDDGVPTLFRTPASEMTTGELARTADAIESGEVTVPGLDDPDGGMPVVKGEVMSDLLKAGNELPEDVDFTEHAPVAERAAA